MKWMQLSLILLIVGLFTAPALACNFCSSKPKTLTNGLAQDPGSANLSNASGNGSGRPQSNGANQSNEPFKQNPTGGQPSSNPKWSSSDFFEGR